MLCAIWYHWYNLKNVKSTHGGVLKPVTLLKLTLLHGCLSRFLNCTNGTKLRNTSHLCDYYFHNFCRHFINPFYATFLFLHPLKTSKNLWFSDIFRRYRKRSVTCNGLKTTYIQRNFLFDFV